MTDWNVATIVLVFCGVLAPAFSLKQGTSLEDNLVCIRGDNDAVRKQLETFKRVYLLENLFLNISASPSRWSEELYKALRTHQHFHSITIFKIEKIEFPFRIMANHLHIIFSPGAVDRAHKRMKPISFEGAVVKSLKIEVAMDESIPSPSTSLRQLRLNEQLRQLTLQNFGKFYEFLGVLDNCSKNIQAITWVGEQGVVSAKCAGSHIIAQVESNSLKAELMDFVHAAQISTNVTVLLSENLNRTSGRTLQNFLNPIRQYYNVQRPLSPSKEAVKYKKNSISKRFTEVGSEIRWKPQIDASTLNDITRPKSDQNSRSSSSIGKSLSTWIEKKTQSRRVTEVGNERREKQVMNVRAFIPNDIQSATPAITQNDKNSLSSRLFRNSLSTLMKWKPLLPNMKKFQKAGHQSTTTRTLNDGGLTPGLVDYISSCDEDIASLQFREDSAADANPCYDVENSSKEEEKYTLNSIEKEMLRVQNQTRANYCSREVDGPTSEPVDIASNGVAAPLPLPQDHLEEVNRTSLLVSTEDTASRTKVDLAFRITILVFFCGVLPLLVAFCVYRYSRSRSSLIEPVSFALRTRADI